MPPTAVKTEISSFKATKSAQKPHKMRQKLKFFEIFSDFRPGIARNRWRISIYRQKQSKNGLKHLNKRRKRPQSGETRQFSARSNKNRRKGGITRLIAVQGHIYTPDYLPASCEEWGPKPPYTPTPLLTNAAFLCVAMRGAYLLLSGAKEYCRLAAALVTGREELSATVVTYQRWGFQP